MIISYINNINFPVIYVGMVIFRFLLDIIYYEWLSPLYAYQGFRFSFSIDCYFFSWVAVLIMSACLKKMFFGNSISRYIVILVTILYFFPQCTLFALNNNDYYFFLYVCSYFMLIILFFDTFNIDNIYIPIISKVNVCDLLIIFFGLVMFCVSGYFANFRISFDLSEYYEMRFAARENNMPWLISYLFTWAKWVLPVGGIYSLVYRKWPLVIYTTLMQILCFSYNGKKSALFLFVLTYLVAFFYKEKYLKQIITYFCCICFMCIVENIVRDGESAIMHYIIRRVMFTPANIGYDYYDFFSSRFNEFDLMRQSFFKYFGFPSPYNEQISYIIGRIYGNASSLNAINYNTGLCGDAFSNFGYFSLLIYPLLTVVIFKFFGAVTCNLDIRIIVFTGILISYMFLNGGLTKMLFQNGLLLIFGIMSIMPRKINNK